MTFQETLQDLNDLFSIFDNPKDKFIQLTRQELRDEREKIKLMKAENNQLNKAVLIPPMCNGPVGEGANLVATLDIENV